MKIINTFIYILILCHLNSCFDNSKSDDFYVELLQKQKDNLDHNTEQSILIGKEIISSNTSDSIKAISLNYLGNIYFKQGNFTEAFKNLIIAKEKYSLESHEKNNVINNSVMLSNVYKTIGLQNEAKKELESTHLILNENNDQNLYLKSYLLVAESSIYHKEKDWDNFTTHLNHAENLLNQIKDKSLEADKLKLLSMVYSDLCLNYIRSLDFDKAEQYLNQSIQLVGNEKEFYKDYYNLITLAEIQFGKGNLDESISILNSILSQKNINTNIHIACHNLLRDIYSKQNNIDNQNYHQKQFDSLNTLEHHNIYKGNEQAYQLISEELQKNKDNFIVKEKFYFISIILIVVFSFLVYQYNLKKQKTAYQKLKDNILNKTEKNIVIKEEKLTESENILLEKLQKFEEDKGFLNKNMTLANLSVKLNTNTHYLSEIINKTKGKNINTYINELRIDFITKEIYNNPELLNYKISYIAEMAGFNSHNSFTIIFKRVTGISPSVFLEQRRKEVNKN